MLPPIHKVKKCKKRFSVYSQNSLYTIFCESTVSKSILLTHIVDLNWQAISASVETVPIAEWFEKLSWACANHQVVYGIAMHRTLPLAPLVNRGKGFPFAVTHLPLTACINC